MPLVFYKDVQHKSKKRWISEMSQMLKTLSSMEEDVGSVQFPAPTKQLTTTITPVLCEPMPSPDLLRF